MPQSGFESTELPALQSRTHCVLIPRDPNFIYAYWDYTQEDIDRARNQLKFESEDSQLILRIYDITGVEFRGSNANYSWDLDVGFTSKNWYVHVWQDNADYCAELGIRSGNNHFIPLTRSDVVHTPPKSMSQRNDLIWQDIKAHKESQPYIKETINERYRNFMQKRSKQKHINAKKSQSQRNYYLTAQEIRDYYMRLFSKVSRKHRLKAMGKVLSLKDILKGQLKGESWQKVRPIMTSFDLIKHTHPGASQMGEKGASENLFSSQGASEGRLNKRKFFFEIWTELIVYGRTEHDAAVWLNQKGIKLNPDGTFSLRYALPDGEIPLKFIAQSSDGVEQRHIYTRVEREKTIGFPKMLSDNFQG